MSIWPCPDQSQVCFLQRTVHDTEKLAETWNRLMRHDLCVMCVSSTAHVGIGCSDLLIWAVKMKKKKKKEEAAWQSEQTPFDWLLCLLLLWKHDILPQQVSSHVANAVITCIAGKLSLLRYVAIRYFTTSPNYYLVDFEFHQLTARCASRIYSTYFSFIQLLAANFDSHIEFDALTKDLKRNLDELTQSWR